MHELSIARNIVEIAESYARNNQVKGITRIDVDVGIFSGVVMDALEFAMEEAVKGSVLEHAEVALHEIPGSAACNQCKHVFEPDDFFGVCPNCREMDFEITRGKELQIRSMHVKEGK